MWLKEEPNQFSMGQTAQTAQSLTCFIMEKPHTGLGNCRRILLPCLKVRNFGEREREREREREKAILSCFKWMNSAPLLRHFRSRLSRINKVRYIRERERERERRRAHLTFPHPICLKALSSFSSEIDFPTPFFPNSLMTGLTSFVGRAKLDRIWCDINSGSIGIKY